MKNYLKENKKTVIIILIFIILIIALEIVLNLFNTKNKVLMSSYIKTLTKNDISNLPCDESILKENKIPYFKLNNNLYNKINEEILENSLLRACFQNGYIDYDVSLNDNILSLILYISYESDNELTNIEYKTYNINIQNNMTISNQELLNRYNLTVNDINNKVVNYLNNYYIYEKENNLIDTGTSFSKYLNILDYKKSTLSNMSLFIDKKNDLYIYKEFSLSEGMRIVDYFPNLTNTFKLTN